MQDSGGSENIESLTFILKKFRSLSLWNIRFNTRSLFSYNVPSFIFINTALLSCTVHAMSSSDSCQCFFVPRCLLLGSEQRYQGKGRSSSANPGQCRVGRQQLAARSLPRAAAGHHRSTGQDKVGWQRKEVRLVLHFAYLDTTAKHRYVLTVTAYTVLLSVYPRDRIPSQNALQFRLFRLLFKGWHNRTLSCSILVQANGRVDS